MELFKPTEYRNFIEPAYQTQIYNYLTDVNFDWHFMEDATAENNSNDPKTSTPAFGNLLYYVKHNENPHYDFFKPLVEHISKTTPVNVEKLLRVRAGFLLNTKYSLPSMPYKHNMPHVDYDQEHYTAVYYVNHTDGDTVVFRETEPAEKYYPLHKSMPEAGKLLLFNGKHYHASTCPKMFTKRLAITINFTGSLK